MVNFTYKLKINFRANILFAVLLFIILIPVSIYSQEINSIKNSNAYYWGEASSENVREAEDNALIDMMNKIAVNVAAKFIRNVTETDAGIKDHASKIMQSYTTATLKNVESIRIKNGEMFNVLRYIKKSEVQEIFSDRIKLVQNLYQKANEFRNELNYADALKYYYYAIILINSIPEQNIFLENLNLKTELPTQVNSIINSVSLNVVKNQLINPKERQIWIEASYNGKKITNLDLSFWDGNNQIDVTVKDGISILDLVGGSVDFDKLSLSIKYEYYETRTHIKEVGELWDLVVKPGFKNTQQINLKEQPRQKEKIAPITENKKKETVKIENVNIKSDFNLHLNNPDSCKVVNNIANSTLAFLNTLSSANPNTEVSKQNYDSFLLNKIRNILKYNNIRFAEKEIYADINKTFEGWELRSIKTLNNYKSIHKQSPEYVVLDFDNEGNLYNISFGVMENLYEQFKQQSSYSNDWKERQVIVKFMEKYRTAYLTRDSETLDKIFAEDAVIIIGRLSNRLNTKDTYKYLKISDEQPSFEQIQLTKKDFIQRQKSLFANTKDLFLGFSTFKINKKTEPAGVYGLSLRQHYQSTHYSDEGYLFLLVDFNQELPQIYVRAWQPQEWDDSALLKLSNFRINK